MDAIRIFEREEFVRILAVHRSTLVPILIQALYQNVNGTDTHWHKGVRSASQTILDAIDVLDMSLALLLFPGLKIAFTSSLLKTLSLKHKRAGPRKLLIAGSNKSPPDGQDLLSRQILKTVAPASSAFCSSSLTIPAPGGYLHGKIASQRVPCAT